ncbi:putative membrane protein [Alkalibacillus filiformis]|uniref:Membrane protein n=1 Tax=Alkalibacillus filiformis TaxID=200990 RepID=A0ABU0DXN7_9BACI|nr:hypothetical protein [Alkalibacillus filiformis]MDQ0353079.1 putative membrane protein [Alkalibacillus filiformis]
MGSERLEKAIANARASLAIEGMELEEKEVELVKERLRGQITEEEFKQRVLDSVRK